MPRIKSMMGLGTQGMLAQAIAGGVGTVVATGSNSQANAATLSHETNVLTTASGADSVVAPTTAQGSQIGDSMKVYTNASTSAKVFPGGSETFNDSTSAVTLAQSKMMMAKRISATNWAYVVTA